MPEDIDTRRLKPGLRHRTRWLKPVAVREPEPEEQPTPTKGRRRITIEQKAA